MVFVLSHIAAALCFLGGVLVLERLTRVFCRRADAPAPLLSHRERLAGGAALLCLLFIPPGSLPPLCDAPWGGIAWFLLFCCSGWLDERRLASDANLRPPARIMPYALAGLALALFAWCAWRRGLPGSPLNLGAYAAMPLRGLLDTPGKAGLLFLFLGLVLACPRLFFPADNRSFPAGRLRRLAYICLLAALFVPRPLSGFSFSPGWVTFAVDFLAFWTTVLVIECFCDRLPLKAGRPLFTASLCGLGALLLLASLQSAVGILPPGSF